MSSTPPDAAALSTRIRLLILAAVLTAALSGLSAGSKGGPEFPNFNFEHLARNEGLSNMAISSIAQDSHGYLWFGTQNGLDRYDGLGITVFEHDPFQDNTISHNLIQTMYMESTDILWIGTYSGLNRLDTKSGAITRFVHDPKDPESLSNNIVVSIYRDNTGLLWAGTLDGLNALDEKTGKFRRYMADGNPGSLRHKTIRCIVQDGMGRLWVGTGGGLHLFRRDQNLFQAFTHNPRRIDSLPSDSIMSMSIDPAGTMWIGCWGSGIARMVDPTGVFASISLEDTRIYSVMARDDRFVYVGTWGGGLFLIDRKTMHTQRYQNEMAVSGSLSNNTVYSIFKDPAGILWVGTNGGGLNKFNFQRTRFESVIANPDEPGGLGKGKVTALLEDQNGQLWVGTYNGGVYMRPRKQKGFIKMAHRDSDPTSLSNDVVTKIYEDRNGNIWICTTHGLNRWIRGTSTFIQYLPGQGPAPNLPDDIIYDITQTPDGAYWLATYTRGVARWNPAFDSWKLISYDPDTGIGLADNMVYSLYVDMAGMIWACTNGGLSRINPKNLQVKSWVHDSKNLSSLSFNSVRLIKQDSQGRYWIGTTGGGLDRYNPATDSFIHRNKKNGLAHNTVNSIQEDKTGKLWIGTQEGLCVYNPGADFFTTYTDEDGLQDIEFSTGNTVTMNGEMLFGGPKGYSIISNFETTPIGPVPNIQIGSYQVNNQTRNTVFPASLMDKIRIAPDENYFSFYFTVMDFAKPKKNQYAWKLEGFDKDWIYSSNRNFASYTNIPPGSYVFRVKGSNSAGVWNNTGLSMPVEVETPWYLRWWALILYSMIAITLGLMAIRMRTAQVLGKKVKELQILKNQLEDANAQLAFLSTHDQLTGIPNRRALDQRMAENLALCHRHQIPLGVIMIDVDHFKHYNDQHGHLFGDLVLKSLARILSSNIHRSSDLVGRYGGEEFMMLLPGTSLEGTLQVAEELRQAVESAGILRNQAMDPEYLDDLVHTLRKHGTETKAGCTDGGELLCITISAGVASTIPQNQEDAHKLVSDADEALYRAKESGRNRVCS